MAGSKSKPKAIEIAKKMSKKRPNSALTDGEEIEKTQDAKRCRGEISYLWMYTSDFFLEKREDF